ncbi:MAG: amidinotransferase [Planctomycetes bacterium]|nr:amidinotransferase [Planctomycetota bacterium]MCB9904750.1 amidinotransferase [Planctomycetota bacterium]
MLIRSPEDLGHSIRELAPLPPARRVLIADPRDYDVRYAINPHMLDGSGALKTVDRELARKQWRDMKSAFEAAGLEVDVLPPLDGHPDLCFCANPALWIPAEAAPNGTAHLVRSRMAHAERHDEVAHLVQHMNVRGVEIEGIEGPADRFEGSGDGMFHPGRRLLWGGVGPRTELAAWAEIGERFELPVAAVQLVDPLFYHLDTCLAPLDEERCLWFPPAFNEAGAALIRAFYPRAIEVADREAREGLACNAWCPDGERVFLPAGCEETASALGRHGFQVIEIECGEFRKAGGAVFCLKLVIG